MSKRAIEWALCFLLGGDADPDDDGEVFEAGTWIKAEMAKGNKVFLNDESPKGKLFSAPSKEEATKEAKGLDLAEVTKSMLHTYFHHE